MKRLVVVLSLFMALIVLGTCNVVNADAADPTTLNTPADYVAQYGGSINVYQKLMISSDCIYLQESFNRAYKGHEMYVKRHHRKGMSWCLGYMACSSERMEVLGCYK